MAIVAKTRDEISDTVAGGAILQSRPPALFNVQPPVAGLDAQSQVLGNFTSASASLTQMLAPALSLLGPLAAMLFVRAGLRRIAEPEKP